MSSNKKIFNWLLLNEDTKNSTKNCDSKSKISIIKNNKKYSNKILKLKEVEENELTKSPVSGTYIIKDWSLKTKGKDKNSKLTDQGGILKTKFTKNEIDLNSIAASFVEITPQSRAKLAKIPNRIGPYECKLCKVVYNDAFELAMHNCPRVVHIEYKCSECGKIFNCPANLASHKRWHKPKSVVIEQKQEGLKVADTSNTKNEIEIIPTTSNWNNFNNPFSYTLNSSMYNNQLLYQQSTDALPNTSLSAASTNILNQNDWFQYIYSNYISAATQSLFTGVSLGLPVQLPDLVFNNNYDQIN